MDTIKKDLGASKKVICCVLIACLVFALSACGLSATKSVAFAENTQSEKEADSTTNKEEMFSFKVPVVQELQGAPSGSSAKYKLEYVSSLSESEPLMPKGADTDKKESKEEEKKSEETNDTKTDVKKTMTFEIKGSTSYDLVFCPTHAGVWSYKVVCTDVVSADSSYTVKADTQERELMIMIENMEKGLSGEAVWIINGEKKETNKFVHVFTAPEQPVTTTVLAQTNEYLPWVLIGAAGVVLIAAGSVAIVRRKKKM